MVERIDYYAEVSGEQPDPLWPVRAAAAAAKAADRDLRRAVRSAYGAGVGKSELSEVAGISRPTLNAWLSDGRDPRTPPESSWGQVLDEALMDLAERVGAGAIEQLWRGLSSRDVAVKARRVELGRKNARGRPEQGTGEWDRYVESSLVLDALRQRGVL